MINTFIIFSIRNSVREYTIFSPEIAALLKWNNVFNQSYWREIEFLNYKKKRSRKCSRSTFVFSWLHFFLNYFVRRVNHSILSFVTLLICDLWLIKKSSFDWKLRYGEMFISHVSIIFVILYKAREFSLLFTFLKKGKTQAEQGTFFSCDHVALNVSEFRMPVGCLPSRILTFKQNINTTLRFTQVRKNLLRPQNLCQSKNCLFYLPQIRKNIFFCITVMGNWGMYTTLSHFGRTSLSSVRKN